MKDIIKIGLIGLGERGMKTLSRYFDIQDAMIIGLSDLSGDKVDAANEMLRLKGTQAKYQYKGEDNWKNLCHCRDIDLIYICTDWRTHTQMAIYAMENGKDVAVEVPIATTIEECWQLVDCVESTGKKCFMTENCCYDFFSLQTLEMKKQGLLGDITHCEGGYIHYLLDNHEKTKEKIHHWMLNDILNRHGNIYPTHGLGPIGWLLDIHRGDRLDYLVAMDSYSTISDHVCGRVNNTLIKTVKGASILLQFDVTTPRPYSRLQTVCGTLGYIQKFPTPIVCTEELGTLKNQECLNYMERFSHSSPYKKWKEGNDLGVDNAMNYAMDTRLIHCLRNDLPLDIDIYDAVEWSCIAALSEESVRKGSIPISIPDFTRGKWKTNAIHRFY